MSLHIIENDSLAICIADAGAELISVFDKEAKTERIWTADPSIWNRHAPILFPFVGKVTDGVYRIDGKEYQMIKQHGFARDMEFSCISETEESIEHSLSYTPETMEVYPYAFKLTVRHLLNSSASRRLVIEWEIENHDSKPMYYSIGGHPGFLLPSNIKKEDCFLVFPGKEELQYFSANAAGFALPEDKHVLHLEQGFAPYQKDIPDTWIFEDQQIKSVGIAGPDREAYVTMNCDQFPMLAVWANSKGPFICLEPWFGRTDDDGFHESLKEKKGMEKLNIGELKKISYSIEFHPTKYSYK